MTLSVRTPAMIYEPRFLFVMGFNDTGKMSICNMEHVLDVPSYLCTYVPSYFTNVSHISYVVGYVVVM